jgi:Predicted RNA-binding protein homologous to eukaryotic snRNP
VFEFQGDIYMHADIHGAASVVIKNPERKPIPTLTLEEAAIFTICRSKAWESKVTRNFI